MAKKKQYYEIRDTIAKYPDAKYYIIFGERSNGKSYSFLSYATEQFYKNRAAFGYIRRWKDDTKTSNMNQVFKSLKTNDKGDNEIARVTKNEYNDVEYLRGCFYLIHRDDEGAIDKKIDDPLGYVFSLSESERVKSTGYPDIRNIVLEEFITENPGNGMVNEFTRFTSLISTIVRNKALAKIFLLGNTVNAHNIYFREFGVLSAKKQPKNSILTHEFKDDSGEILQIITEYCDFPDKSVKKSNVYFAFNKDRNKMIRTGQWAMSNYPHLPNYYKKTDILFIYFILFEDEIFQCEIIKVKDTKDSRIILNEGDTVSNKNVMFTYIHQKTSEIKYPNKHIIFQQEYNPNRNYRRAINNPIDEIGRRIWKDFQKDNVYFQDNTVGDMIRAYLEWCNSC